MRTLAISDIHGCYDEFNALLKKVHYNPSEDKLILLGDYVDRGQKSKQVVEQVKTLKEEWEIIVLRGNHDQMFLHAITKEDYSYDQHWLSNGAFQTLESYVGLDFFESGFEWNRYLEAKEFIKTHYNHHINFLKTLPLYHETDEHIFVHAGVNPLLGDWKNTKTDDFIWIRELFYTNPNTNTDKTIIFGHTPAIHLHETEDVWFSPHGDKIGVDGACAYGMQLNCLEISEDGCKTHFVKKGEAL